MGLHLFGTTGRGCICSGRRDQERRAFKTTGRQWIGKKRCPAVKGKAAGREKGKRREVFSYRYSVIACHYAFKLSVSRFLPANDSQ